MQCDGRCLGVDGFSLLLFDEGGEECQVLYIVSLLERGIWDWWGGPNLLWTGCGKVAIGLLHLQ